MAIKDGLLEVFLTKTGIIFFIKKMNIIHSEKEGSNRDRSLPLAE